MTLSIPRHNGDFRRSHEWTAYFLLLLLAGSLQFWSAREFEWLYDDFDHLKHVHHLDDNPGSFFSPKFETGGRMTTTLFLLILHQIFGDAQVPQHLVLILAHIVATFILARTLSAIGMGTHVSMIAGALFLFNVSHYSVPYWLSCFGYIGCLAFGCLGIMAYLNYLREGDRLRLVATCLLFVLAVTSHAGAISFAILAAYFASREGSHRRRLLKTSWVPVALCLTVTATLLQYYPHHAQTRSVAEIRDLRHVAELTVAYLGRTFLSPHWMPVSYTRGPSSFDQIIGIGLIAVAIVLFRIRPGRPLDALVWAIVCLPLFGGSTLDEYRPRYFYFASVGPSILIAWGFLSLGRQLSSFHSLLQYAIPGVCIFVLIGISSTHLKRTEMMHWSVIGRNRLSDGEIQEGVRFLQKSMTAVPAYLPEISYTRYGQTAHAVGVDPTDALTFGLDAYPESEQVENLYHASEYISMGSKLPTGYVERARNSDYAQALAATFQNAAGYAYRNAHYHRALQLYGQAIRILPEYGQALAGYGNTLVLLGEYESALLAYQELNRMAQQSSALALPGLRKLLATIPETTEVRGLLAESYRAGDQLQEAVAQIVQVLKIGSQDRHLRAARRLLETLERRGMTREASVLKEALSQHPPTHGRTP